MLKIWEYQIQKISTKNCMKKNMNKLKQSITKLINNGANINHKDKFGKTVAHYLAEWKYAKENSEDPFDLEMPKRTVEILGLLNYKESRVSKSPGSSLLSSKDED